MALWHLEWDPSEELDLSECRVITYREWQGKMVALVTCDEATVNRLRHAPGLQMLRRPASGERFVDRTGHAVVIEGDGLAWRTLRQGE